LKELTPENDDQKQHIKELQIALWSNISLGHLRKKEWKWVKYCTEKVLELDPNNVKALYREAKALNCEGEHQKAKELLTKALKILPSSTEVQNELHLTTQLLEKQHNKEKKVYSEMFNKLRQDEALYHVIHFFQSFPFFYHNLIKNEH
jgi:FK506-binding protein 4/5